MAAAHGGRMVGDGGLARDVAQAPASPVVDPKDAHGCGDDNLLEEAVSSQASAPLPPSASADGGEMVGALPQAPAALVVEPKDAHGSDDDNLLEEAVSSRASAALPPSASADGGKIVGALPQAPAAPVVEPTGGRRSIGEIQSVEEDPSAASAAPLTGSTADGVEVASTSDHLHLHRAPAGPPPGSVPAEGREQLARSRLDEESGGVSNLRTLTWANNWGTLLCVSAHPKCAKWVYAAIISGGIAFAMYWRNTELSGFTQDTNGYNDKRYNLGMESALRVSLALCGFFTVMFFSTVWTNKVHAYRNFWNSNMGWALLGKIALMAVCVHIALIIPSASILVYGNVARAGAGLYLAIQLVSVTKLIVLLNTCHPSNPERRGCTAYRRWLVKAGAILSNFGSFGIILWLMNNHRSNIVDFVIISITLMLIVIMIIIRLKSEVTAGWLAPGLMISYLVFMCWTVITSEPHRDINKARDPKGPDWLTILSLLFLVYSILTTAVDEWLQFKEEVPSADDIPYGFGYFHLVFALGSMYFGMVLVGWNAHQTMQSWTIDYGWWSAVVRAINGLLAAMLYIWMLRTPFIWNKKKLVLSRSRASRVPRVTFI